MFFFVHKIGLATEMITERMRKNFLQSEIFHGPIAYQTNFINRNFMMFFDLFFPHSTKIR